MSRTSKNMFSTLVLGILLFITGCSNLPGFSEENDKVQIETSNVISTGEVGADYKVSQEEKDYLSKRFNNYLSINKETVGYINIPGTKVDEPIVQTGDNSTYLEKSFEGGISEIGAIFMDKRNNGKFDDKLTWLFGHVLGSKFPNNRMFKDVMNYKDQKYFDEHKYVVIETPERKYYYEAQVFMVVPETTEYYRTDFNDEADFQSQLDEINKLNSLNKQEKILTKNDNISLDSKYNYLVLSTCLDFGNPEELRYNLYLKQIPDEELNEFLKKNKDKLEYQAER